MIAEFLTVASLAVGLPVTCDEGSPFEVVATAYYQERTRSIHVMPKACAEVRDGTAFGAWLLGHELGHAFQDAMGLPYDEEQADLLGVQWAPALVVALGGSGRPAVRLGP